MAKFAIIKTGGKQYIVTPGMKLKIEKITPPKEGGLINFGEILAVGDNEEAKIEFGKPFLNGRKVSAELVSEGKGKKVTITRFHSKTRYHKKKGHRQPFSEVLIKDIA